MMKRSPVPCQVKDRPGTKKSRECSRDSGLFGASLRGGHTIGHGKHDNPQLAGRGVGGRLRQNEVMVALPKSRQFRVDRVNGSFSFDGDSVDQNSVGQCPPEQWA